MELLKSISHTALIFVLIPYAGIKLLVSLCSWTNWTWARLHYWFRTRGLTDKSGEPRDVPGNRKVIKTGRTESEINEAAINGFRPLVRAVNRNNKIFGWMTVFQHPQTGEIRTGGHRSRFEGFNPILSFPYYPYNFPSPIAAYIVPPDIVVGESVWLEDIIEDIVHSWGPSGGGSRLEQGVAIWNGEEFVVQFKSWREAQHYKG